METLNAQFDSALARVNLGEKVARAKKAHEEVRAVLADDETLKSYGVETILIGSYGRDVAIWPGHDVDVFVKLPDFDADPEALYATVLAPLKNRYKERLDDTGAHAISISFGDDFSVDAVGAAPSTTGHWMIPAMDPTLKRRVNWEESDPEKLGELAVERNKAPLVGAQGAYKPIVKLVRQIRSHHMKKDRPRGLYFEMLTYRAFEAGVKGETFAELLTAMLSWIASQLETGLVVCDPALGEYFSPPPTPEQLSNAASIFREQATAAVSALTMELCPAAATWRKILGENDNGAVFPLPDGCDASGKVIKTVGNVSALGSDEGRGFAGS
jgi:hypothetical protein